MKQWDWQSALQPGEALRKPGEWEPISRSEAARLQPWVPVVVVARSVAGARAEWFDDRSPLARAGGPHCSRQLRFYRYTGPVRAPAAATRARVVGTPPQVEEVMEERRAAPLTREEKTWIEIRLIDEDKQPVAGEPYVVELPDGSSREGETDSQGLARLERIDPGTCKISFPNLDGRDWKKV